MLGAAHFKRKLAKKAAKKTRRMSEKEDRSKARVNPPGVNPRGSSDKANNNNNPRNKQASKLKGPVVSYSTDDRGERDRGNDRRNVPFPNKREEQAYCRTMGSKLKTAESARQKSSGASSKAQRKRFQKASGDELIDQFRGKLTASTFRLLNEQIYCSTNAFAKQLLRDPVTFADYHRGYRAQLAQWPINPNQLMIDALLNDRRGRFTAHKAKSLAGHIPPSWVIADMGCGDAQIAKALKPHGYTVHSFDFCAVDDHVTIANTASVPLPSQSVDICIFSLSLMATDYFDSLLEAYRILKPKRLLKIIEVRSRIPHSHRFAELVCGIGFTLDWSDVVGDYFVAFDLLRNDGEHPNSTPQHNPGDVLFPCMYKKR